MANASLKRDANIWHHFFDLTVIMLVLFINAPAHAAGTAIAAQIEKNAGAQIELLEENLCGQSKAGVPLLARIDALETLAFGEPSSGPLKERIARLQQFLQSSQGSNTRSATAGQSTAGHTASTVASHNAKSLVNHAANPVASRAASAAKAQLLQKQMTEAMRLFQAGNEEQAKIAFEQILSGHPDCVDAYYNLGNLAERRAERQTALIYYRKAATLAANDEQIQAAVTRMALVDPYSSNTIASGSSLTEPYPSASSSPSSSLSSSTGTGPILHTAIGAGKVVLNLAGKALSVIH